MQSLEYTDLQSWQKELRDFELIDVRESFEHDHFNIGGINIPLGELHQNIESLSKEKDLVIYCAKGIRSVIAIQKLESKGFHNLWNLSGGIEPLLNTH